MRQSLSASEWTLLAIFFILIVTFIFVAKVSAHRAIISIAQLDDEPQMEFLVTIDGAVKKPGEYRILEGTPLETAIKKARPTLFADLKAISLKKRVLSPTHIHIPEQQAIHVTVSGAIAEPLELVMPVGSRIADLKTKIGMTSETDRKFFRKRKRLIDGDQIIIPRKHK